MMRNFPLEKGIYCNGQLNNFKLYYDNKALTPVCNAIAYIPKSLIAVKSKKTVYLYIPEIVTDGDKTTLVKVASFESFDTYAYLKVKINGKSYIIDSNLQIKPFE